jgi:hypothetical protein
MSEWTVILNWFTFAWVAAWAAYALMDICSDRRRSVSFLLLVFFVLYGIPIVLDLTLGVPNYDGTPGFRAGATSDSVIDIYDLFVILCPAFWWLTARSRQGTDRKRFVPAGNVAQRVLWLLLCSPLIALPFAPQPGVYLSYAVVLSDTMSPDAAAFHATIGGLTMIAMVAGTGLLLSRRSFGRTCWLIMPFVTAAMWLNGKRTIVALCFVLFWAAMWMRGLLSRSRIIVFGSLSLVLFIGYIALYQFTFRPIAVANSYSIYENSRVDYVRDQNLKAAILCELPEGDVPILDYRGESILFDIAMYVPRALWPDKPWPYAIYLTSHALEIPVTDLGWGLTSSLLDESVANFGWMGLLIGPLIFALICRVCDRSPDPLVKVTGVLIACLLMTVELVAFAPLFVAWVLYLWWSGYVQRHTPRTRVTLRIGSVRARA